MKLSTTMLSLAALSLLLAAPAWAQPQVVTPSNRAIAKPLVNPAVRVPVQAQTDLRIDYLVASRCSCDLPGVNAYYMPDLRVAVSNHALRGGAKAATRGELRVSFFDMGAGRQVVITRPVPRLNPYPGPNPWTTEVTIFSAPRLIRSDGIRAEVVTQGGVTDGDPANNVRVSRRCEVMVY